MEYKIEYNERPNDDPEYLPIDFTVRDKNDEPVAFVWGKDTGNVEVECNHEDIEWGDDDEGGICRICGAECMWHWSYTVVDEGHDSDGNYYAIEGQERMIDEWSIPLIHKSLIKEELYGKETD